MQLSFVGLLATFLSLLLLACNETPKNAQQTVDIEKLLSDRYDKLLAFKADSVSFPRSYDKKKSEIRMVASPDWTSGFYPGNLWLLDKLLVDNRFRQKAEVWTNLMINEQFNDRTHDMGFKIYCSYGNGYEITNNEEYKKVIINSAKTLSTRFNEKIGSLRSWDWNKDIWEFPVIIDNMMNLELLFETTRLTKDSFYHNLAVTHANTTLKNHFREDGSSYHVVVYDTLAGNVLMKVTHQGLNDESVWARGQAWGIYGYTMAYRYTQDQRYLDRAKASADFFLSHPNLREDGIPYWDFYDPDIPDSPRDVSAGAIMAACLFELAEHTGTQRYADYSKKVLKTLQSTEYILDADLDLPFILDHSTGNWPKEDEIDGPINYGDYYFLEALIRSKGMGM